MDAEESRTIGRRLREVRYWRRMSLRAVAELAGLSESHLSRIERGQRIVDKRSTLEALAHALRVSPGELTGQPFRPTDPLTAEAHAAIAELQVALAEPALGDSWVPRGRPWPELTVELHVLNTVLRPAADYAGQGRMLPGLLSDLHAAMAHEPDHRAEVLQALMDCYHAAEELTKSLGVPGLPQLAAVHAQTVAEELDTPAWLGLAAWLRGMTVGTSSRETMLAVSQRAAADLQPATGSLDAAQMYGAVHLNAALASAALNRPGGVDDHLAEADEIARVIPANAPGFGQVYFGLDNIGIWRVSLAVELGESGGKLAEVGRNVDPFAVPSGARQAMYFGDLGRGLARERSTRRQAVVALRRAEEIAPQLVHSNFYVRETVTDLLRRARSDASGRELCGMAYRMGLSA